MSSILAREIAIQSRNGASLDDVLDFARKFTQRAQPPANDGGAHEGLTAANAATLVGQARGMPSASPAPIVSRKD